MVGYEGLGKLEAQRMTYRELQNMRARVGTMNLREWKVPQIDKSLLLFWG